VVSDIDARCAEAADVKRQWVTSIPIAHWTIPTMVLQLFVPDLSVPVLCSREKPDKRRGAINPGSQIHKNSGLPA
jgi:hypothetical protein